MKVYISGQITGLQIDDAKANFKQAAEYLHSIGHTTINPFDLNDDAETWESCMLVDILEVFQCDAVYMLANWKHSKGARIEYAIADIMGKDLLYEKSCPCSICR